MGILYEIMMPLITSELALRVMRFFLGATSSHLFPFNYRFFQKSPREATTQDPQQRIFLQSAYQAVEQSGYFNSLHADRNVGVYVGVCAADYEANIACYPPNAFSATGNLKSFIAGKISHYFGWHGYGHVPIPHPLPGRREY